MLAFINRKFPVFLVLYFLLFACVRWISKTNLELDEAEQFYLSQTWFLGHGQQPPLFTWLNNIFIQIFGYSTFSIGLLRSVLLAGTFYFVYKTAKFYVDKAWAVICALSLFLFLQISIESFRHTHTVLITCISAATLWQWHRIKQKPTYANYIILGIAFGLGILSKYNYALITINLMIASIVLKPYRKIVFSPKMAASCIIAVLIFSPHAWWLSQHFTKVFESVHKDLSPEKLSYFKGLGKGFGSLIAAFLSFSGIFLALNFIFERRNLKKIFHKVTFNIKKMNLITVFMLVSFLSLVILVLLGSIKFHERWLEPFFIFIPITFFTILQKLHLQIRKSVFKFLVFLSVFVLIFHLSRFRLESALGIENKAHCDYATLAETLKQKQGKLVAEDLFVAGNLKINMPERNILLKNSDEKTTSNHVIFVQTIKNRKPKDYEKNAKKKVFFKDNCFLVTE